MSVVSKNSLSRRKMRIRKRIMGTLERPRFTVSKSLRSITAQIIDDTKGVTLVSASTNEKVIASGKNMENAKLIGKTIAERATAKNISQVVFDRNGYRYHGKIKALADSAREAGLQF